jgi:hypothetical protein
MKGIVAIPFECPAEGLSPLRWSKTVPRQNQYQLRCQNLEMFPPFLDNRRAKQNPGLTPAAGQRFALPV